MPEDNLILGNKKGGLLEGRLYQKIYQNIKA
jgi:hypothetical protein